MEYLKVYLMVNKMSRSLTRMMVRPIRQWMVFPTVSWWESQLLNWLLVRQLLGPSMKFLTVRTLVCRMEFPLMDWMASLFWQSIVSSMKYLIVHVKELLMVISLIARWMSYHVDCTHCCECSGRCIRYQNDNAIRQIDYNGAKQAAKVGILLTIGSILHFGISTFPPHPCFSSECWDLIVIYKPLTRKSTAYLLDWHETLYCRICLFTVY